MFFTNKKMTIGEVLDIAITNEKVAADFYTEMSRRCESSGKKEMADMFRDVVAMEEDHYHRLMKVKKVLSKDSGETLTDMREWPVPPAFAGLGESSKKLISENLSMGEALELMKKAEREAEMFYIDAAEKTHGSELSEIFRVMANEEASHVGEIGKIGEKYVKSEE